MGQNKLLEHVLNAGLCTGCGACANLCPYIKSYKDKIIIMDPCDKEDGRCYAYCPRSDTDVKRLQETLFDSETISAELGPVIAFYMTRAAHEEIRSRAQHGGTVTALMALALQEKVIDSAIVAGEADLLPYGVVVSDSAKLLEFAKTKFVVSPTVATFNDAVKGEYKRIGVVATPCQALSLAKMRAKAFEEEDSRRIKKLELVIGLFCGWALSWQETRDLLREKLSDQSIFGMDIPPSKYQCMEVYASKGTSTIPLEEVTHCIREGCLYCSDMTAEFSDISVGSARSREGWEVARGWNHVIVRSKVGDELIQLAKSKKMLEFKKLPEENVEKLKTASMKKKSSAANRLLKKGGNVNELSYFHSFDPALFKLFTN